jgi:hypothetical protein
MDFDSSFDSDSDSGSESSYFTGEESFDEFTDDEEDSLAGADDGEEWRIVAEDGDVRPSPLPEFVGVHGVRPDWEAPEVADGNEAAFLSLYLTDELFENIRRWTNAKAWEEFDEFENIEDVPKHLLCWKDCTVNELRKLVGIVLLMGLDKKPELSCYWSTDLIFHCPFLSQSFSLSRDRFKQISSFLRFYDCSQADDGPLAKMQPFLQQVQQLCKNNYRPSKRLSADETLVPYKGRLHFKQYIPSKKSKHGIKLYCLCESDTAYLWNVVVHTTPEANRRFGEGMNCQNLSMSEKTVVELCRELLNTGHHVFCDSYFTSHRLAKWLLERGTLLTGTVRRNRGIPALLADTVLRPTSSAFARQGDTLACKLVDRKKSGRKTVFFIDTAEVAECRQVRRVRQDQDDEVIAKPSTAIEYTCGMGGVDRMDAALHPYLANRKSLRWFNKLGFYLILAGTRQKRLGCLPEVRRQQDFSSILEAGNHDPGGGNRRRKKTRSRCRS